MPLKFIGRAISSFAGANPNRKPSAKADSEGIAAELLRMSQVGYGSREVIHFVTLCQNYLLLCVPNQQIERERSAFIRLDSFT